MKLTPKFLLYCITIVVVIAACFWEYYMQQWLSYQPNDGLEVLRVDLFVIWPLVITLLSISLYKLFGPKRE